MTISLYKYLIQFVLLIVLQIFILDNVALNGYINPYLYILFVINLPFETNRNLALGLSVLIGLVIDVFSQTIGMHLSATIFLGFARPFILRLLSPREGYEFGLTPSVQNMGFVWFITYAGILTFLHHLFLFTVEAFRFVEFFGILLRTILSSMFTISLIIISQYLFQKTKKK